MFAFKPTRRQLRKLRKGSKTKHNKATFAGKPKQIIQLSDGSHKVIIHKHSKMYK